MRIGFKIKILANLIEKEMRSDSAIRNMDNMTNMHGRIIGFLHRHEDKEIFQRDIEKKFFISGPSVSEILKLMERNGLIERQAVEQDGRLKKIVLTEKARKMDLEVQAALDASEERLAALITPEEKNELDRIVCKMIEKLKDKKGKEIV